MVQLDSDRVSRVPPYSGVIERRWSDFVYRAITHYGQTFQIVPLSNHFVTPRYQCRDINNNPTTTNEQELHFWHSLILGSSQFARRYYGNRFYFLFLRVLRCFSSPGWLLIKGNRSLHLLGCPIQKFTGLRMCAPNRNLSQLTTSFIAYLCQGIRRLPLVTYQSNI